MNRIRTLATVVLLFLAVWLGFELWGAQRERTATQTDLSARKRKLALLRTQLDAAMADRDATGALQSEPTKASITAPSRPAEMPRALDSRIARREEEMVRRNALNGYAAGFDRLRLPPDVLARAKEIILERAQSSAALQKQPGSMMEMLEKHKRLTQEMENQLVALLGTEATSALTAAAREGSIDWAIGTDLWDAGAPLTPDQLQAIARAQVQVGRGPTHWGLPANPDLAPDPRTGLSWQDDDFLAATSSFLSREQQEALRRSLVEDHQYNTSMRTFGEKQRKLVESR